MTVYPSELDDDNTIIRVDDNLSELGVDVINQLRAAVFAIEKELGINPSGSLTSLNDRVSISLNANGTIKSSALTSIGLVSLPIDNAQVGANAGILESKLSLDFSTSDLKAQIEYDSNVLNNLSSFTAITNSNLLSHISGGNLADGSTSRHVSSQIDLNDVPFDNRDPFFIWNGLLDKNGNQRAATTVAAALLEINDEFVSHQLNESGEAHFASGISVDPSGFLTIPKSADTVQKAIDAIDNADALVIQRHQQNLHSNGVPSRSRDTLIGDVDGYSYNIVPPTQAAAYLVKPPSNSPNNSNSIGDHIVSFAPDNTGFIFDSQFTQVTVGDVVRINYGNGLESINYVESKTHVPGSVWVVRLTESNLYNADGVTDGYASVRIDKKRFTTDKYGTLAIASANNNIDTTIEGSIIVGNPRASQALGLEFDSTQLDSSHYNLYLAMYPEGDPSDAIYLPAIDVTGNLGSFPGTYTIHSVVQNVNNAFRSGGYNYRFIAFERGGQFGIMMTDIVDGVSFSIINGTVTSGSLTVGAYANNVIGDATDGKDALGFGLQKAAIASPMYQSSYSAALAAATYPTILFRPLANKDYVVNGISLNTFGETYLAPDGYWDGYIFARTVIGISTVETTYQINLNLKAAGLSPGKTITIQPAIAKTNPSYNSRDYGRFIIKEINFTDCSCENEVYTSITVVNSLHAVGAPLGSSSGPGLQVRLYFGEDSVSFSPAAGVLTRYHEVYINDIGKTFHHERAKMLYQSGDTSLLNTQNFRITNVSPKLKGYDDPTTTEFNKFVRFYVLNYHSNTGEYDGYLGSPIAGDTIENYGRVIRAKKNVPTRFYDASNIDYIEFLLTETSVDYSAPTLITAPRYVDIEIFPTLVSNQENLLLGSFNVTFGNGNTSYIDTVRDLREFGNVSEVDFTDSCIKFIESGDRYLHKTGVIDGFNYVGESTEVEGKLIFTGGLALINGHISTLGQQSISVPEVIESPNISTLDWVVCATESGNLTILPLTLIKQQFFIRVSGGTIDSYIDSVTLDEIYNERKDLCAIGVVNVTIASITVNTVTDARRFIVDEYVPTISNVDGYSSTFKSLESLLNWNLYGKLSEVQIDYLLVDNEFDLTTVSNLKLRDGLVEVTSNNGFILYNDVYLENITFVYNYTTAIVSGNLTHYDLFEGCILMPESAGNIVIDNCKFKQTALGDRPPFIYYYNKLQNSPHLDTVTISRNTFFESYNPYNSAILFFLSNSTDFPGDSDISGNLRYINNININENNIDGYQGIILSALTLTYGFTPKNVVIENNNMPNGVIGIGFGNDSGDSTDYDSLVKIESNYCHAIADMWPDGSTFQGKSGKFSTIVTKNHCSMLALGGSESNTISDNDIYIKELFAGFSDPGTIHGIIVTNNSIVTNNRIHRGELSIYAFIGIYGSGNTCTGNILSHRYNDIAETDYNTIIYDTSDSNVIESNINHIKKANVSLYKSFSPFSLSTSSLEYKSDGTDPLLTGSGNLLQINSILDGYSVVVLYGIAGSIGDVNAILPCYYFIPNTAKIIHARVTVYTESSEWDGGSFLLRIHKAIPNTIIGSASVNLSAAGTVGGVPLITTPSEEVEANNCFIKLLINDADPNTLNKTVSVRGLEVFYTW